MVKETQAKYLTNGKEKQADLEEAFCPDGYKLTEVGVIPEDWKVSCVGDEYVICNSLRLPISRDVRKNMSGIYPYYGPTKIQDFINEYRIEGEYALIGEDGDHFLKYETMSQTQLATGKFNVNNHAHLVKGVKNSTKWFFYFFRHRDISVNLTRQGAGRFKLNKASLMELRCAFPPIIEQEVIAKALSDVDALITSLEKLITKKQAIKTATMQQLLTGKKRLPGFGEGKGYKQTELGEIPEDWEVCLISELGNVRGGKRLPKGMGLQNSRTSYPYIRVADMFFGGVDLSNIKYVPNDVAPIIKNYKINSSDIFISVAGTLGVIGIVPKVLDGANLTENANKITNIKCDKYFLLYSLMSVRIQNDICSQMTVGAQPKLALGRIENFRITIPNDKKEQTAIATILSDIDKEIERIENQLSKTQQIKQGMMQELLTGKTRLI
ncbi:MAG: restriction endonuclease subunit S [Methylococcaceae bacterium]|nr:restriction endonuclease subunit S [Methylococcaceae bacterium]